MKKNNMKKISVIALSALSLALVGGGMAALTPTNVSANTDVTTSVEAYGSPQIRVLGAEEGSYAGIRFGAKINNYKESYSYGMIVAPVALFDKYETIINKDFGGDIKAAATAGKIKLVDLACLPQYGDFDQDGADEWYIQGSLVGIRPANMNADFAGVGYYNDGEKTVYDTTWKDNASSVGYVASKVIHKFDSGSALYNACLDFANGAVEVVNDSATFEIMGTGNLSLTVNGTANMDVKQSPAMNFYVKYVSGNEDVATVSADGTITAVSTGTTTVTAYCVDKTVECEVTVAYDWANIDYDFSSPDDVDMTVVAAYGGGILTGMVADETASDGYAVMGKTINGPMNGYKISFNNIDVTQYSAINIWFRSENKVTANYNQTGIYVNGNTSSYWGVAPSYQSFDLKKATIDLGTNTLSYIVLGLSSRPDAEIYVDKIEFVELNMYTDFTLTAGDLQQFVGVSTYANTGAHYGNGNIKNVDSSSIMVGAYQGKDNILRFTTNGACGGIAVNFTKWLPEIGYIEPSVDFTISVTAYLPTAVGSRCGMLWGVGQYERTSENVWKNPGTGWKTYTITSAELRTIAGVDYTDKNIIGFYIAVNNSGYTYAIESITVNFTK